MIKQKKYLITLSIIFFITGLFLFNFPIEAAQKRPETEKIRIQTPPVAAAIPFFWMEEQEVLQELGIELDIKVSSDHQRGLSLIQKGDIDMLITGSNVGAKAFNRGIDLKLLNIGVWGIDYLLTNDFEAESWSDLEGKTLSLPLQGGPLDFLVRYLMEENGVDPKEIDFDYRPSSSGAKTFMAGDIDAIVLPEPQVTVVLSNSEKANLSFDIQKEWAEYNSEDERIPFVGLFGSEKYIKNKSEYTDLINGFYKLGIKWINDNEKEAAEIADQFMDISPRIIRKSFQRTNLNYFDKEKTRESTEIYFDKIEKMYPEMLGGKLPDEDFYY
ncbi:MAG: ABC transporter substrate-binding protein [Bacillota bacterium]